MKEELGTATAVVNVNEFRLAGYGGVVFSFGTSQLPLMLHHASETAAREEREEKGEN